MVVHIVIDNKGETVFHFLTLLCILLYILLCNVEGWSTSLFHLYIIPSTSIIVSYTCQKSKHCFTFIVYNDVQYHISSLLLSSQMGKMNKQTEMIDAPSRDRSRKRDI